MTDQLSATFAALADPTRRAILARLALGEASVGELAEPFDISLPAISRHLKVLENARLIARERDAQWRRCRIEPEGLKAAADWGLPAPALMVSLAYLDAYRSRRLPANLIQAQRDFFGSHTYERVDRPGSFHTDWRHG